jgi:hypothetical protein
VTDVIFVPRSTWYNRPPHNNDGTTTRPLLAKPVAGGLVIHYTGAPWIGKASTDTAQTYMTWMQAAAFRQSKSFEYNDIVPPRKDGSAQVWEYAGDYMAAHAGAVNNRTWYAIQVAIGVNNHPSYANYDRTKPVQWQPLEDGMVEAIRWRRHDLVERGILAERHEVRGHYQLPNVATTCPGDAVRSRWPDLLVPWEKEPLPPPVITPPMEDDMPEFVKVAIDPAKPADPGTLFAVQGLLAWHVSPSQYGAAGIPASGRTLTRAECSKYTFVGNVPNGYHGIWAQDGHQ